MERKITIFKIYKSIVIAFVMVFLVCFNSFGQTTVPCPVIADAFIPEKNPSINYGSNTSILIGRESTGEPIETLIKFDLSLIPNCATIVNAELNLDYNGSHDQVSADIYLASNTWDENTVTWNNQPSYANWYGWFNVSSGDGSGSYQIPLNDPVIAWIENGVPNYGIYLST